MYSASDVDGLFAKWKAQGMTRAQLIVKTCEAELGWPYVWGAVGAPCSPEKRQYYAGRSSCPENEAKVILSRCQALNGSGKSCGGCQFYPDNMRTLIDDCQGFVKQIHSRVGITLAGGGATRMWNSSSNWAEKGEIGSLPKDKVCCVFQWNSSAKNMQHVGEHIGGGEIIHCSGTVKRGKTTDKGWTHWAIPKGMGGDTPADKPTLRRGSTGDYVLECQKDLLKLGYSVGDKGADGIYGRSTEAAVKAFQNNNRLTADGICGAKTWAALDAAVGPGAKRYTVTIPHVAEAQAEALIRQYPGATKKEE